MIYSFGIMIGWLLYSREQVSPVLDWIGIALTLLFVVAWKKDNDEWKDTLGTINAQHEKELAEVQRQSDERLSVIKKFQGKVDALKAAQNDPES
jgi:hypothetical protein